MNFTGRARDYLVYVVIGSAFATSVVVAINLGLTKEHLVRGLSIIGFTALLYGQFIADSKLLWKYRRFWLLVCAAFVVHSFAMATLVHKHVLVDVPQYIAFVLAEGVLLIALRAALIKHDLGAES